MIPRLWCFCSHRGLSEFSKSRSHERRKWWLRCRGENNSCHVPKTLTIWYFTLMCWQARHGKLHWEVKALACQLNLCQSLRGPEPWLSTPVVWTCLDQSPKRPSRPPWPSRMQPAPLRLKLRDHPAALSEGPRHRTVHLSATISTYMIYMIYIHYQSMKPKQWISLQYVMPSCSEPKLRSPSLVSSQALGCILATAVGKVPCPRQHAEAAVSLQPDNSKASGFAFRVLGTNVKGRGKNR